MSHAFSKIEKQLDFNIAKSMIWESMMELDVFELFEALEGSLISSFIKKIPMAQRNLMAFAQIYNKALEEPQILNKIKEAYSCESRASSNAEILSHCTRSLFLNYGPSQTKLLAEQEPSSAILSKALGIQKASARLQNRHVYQHLLRSNQAPVVALLCENPCSREADIVFIASKRPSHFLALEAVLESAWLQNYSVREALAHNPYFKIGHSLRLLPTLNQNSLSSIIKQAHVHEYVKETAAYFLKLLNEAS